jgi:hypothetical protein
VSGDETKVVFCDSNKNEQEIKKKLMDNGNSIIHCEASREANIETLRLGYTKKGHNDEG